MSIITKMLKKPDGFIDRLYKRCIILIEVFNEISILNDEEEDIKMKISGVAKKGLALVLTMAVAVGGVAIAPSKASAAKKSKSATVKVRTLYAAKCDADSCAWLYGTDSSASAQSIKSYKLTKGKKTTINYTLSKPSKFNGKKVGKVSEAVVFTVDLMDVLKSFKKVNISGVTVKCDGKKAKFKVVQGSFEKNKADSKDNYRISFYNTYGNQGDNSKSVNKASAFKFNKNIQVSFTVTPK